MTPPNHKGNDSIFVESHKKEQKESISPSSHFLQFPVANPSRIIFT